MHNCWNMTNRFGLSLRVERLSDFPASLAEGRLVGRLSLYILVVTGGRCIKANSHKVQHHRRATNHSNETTTTNLLRRLTEAEDCPDFNQLHAYQRTKQGRTEAFTGEIFKRCENPSKSLSVYPGTTMKCRDSLEGCPSVLYLVSNHRLAG